MTDYILRTDNDNELGLLLFTDGTLWDSSGRHSVTAQEQLTAYLRHLIEIDHYSGDGPLVKGLWRWKDDDTREELELKFLQEDRKDDDWIELGYAVRTRDGQEDLFRFTVSIDGRS
jgi:hypothetical protein